MTSKNLKSKILNFDFLENEKSLWRKTKNIFPSLTSTLVYTWKTRSRKCSGHNLFIIHFFLHFNVHWIHVVKALFQQKIRPESPILYEKIIKKNHNCNPNQKLQIIKNYLRFHHVSSLITNMFQCCGYINFFCTWAK